MLEIINLIKRKGFMDVALIFNENPTLLMTMQDFYQRLKEFSNLKSFTKIRDKLIEMEIIEIMEFSRKRNCRIRLTMKGHLILRTLKSLNKIYLSNRDLKQTTILETIKNEM